ncbi:hypothetical protein MtrunA17_Chr1g0199251 [Medicago truncatula]|uniref:Uncharacterized protein n=1 Tax=Medicago truncatula TaxID=3880 RepID=A0A396JZ36_MEDTR|nr:hypothetical protein MtrunA17_Chr1g0199251 [Medicago truncatula]
MAQIPNLDNAPVNLTSIREQSQKELINILKNVFSSELRNLFDFAFYSFYGTDH